MQHRLELRWITLWSRLEAAGDPRPVFKDLVRRYGEPHRAYHTLEHIDHGLREFDRIASYAINPEVVEYTFWFHDAAKTEEESAALAVAAAKNARLSTSFGARVRVLVLATRHDSVVGGPDAWVISDADLSILGQPEPAFDEYERRIYEEYVVRGGIPEREFAEKRSAIIRSFLERKIIFHTALFHGEYDGPARRNLRRSLEKLAHLVSAA